MKTANAICAARMQLPKLEYSQTWKHPSFCFRQCSGYLGYKKQELFQGMSKIFMLLPQLLVYFCVFNMLKQKK